MDGLIVVADIGRPLQAGDRGQVLADAVRSLAEEIGTEMPVILTSFWGPMEFATTGEFCEAEVCASGFSDYYAVHETLILAMLDAFPLEQLEAFGVALFDGGAHFDIREPQESRGGTMLNRVGETGFNNPLMNLYLTR